MALRVESFVEHAVQSGTDATACAYLKARTPEGKVYWGVGLHRNIATASLLALFSATNQALARRQTRSMAGELYPRAAQAKEAGAGRTGLLPRPAGVVNG